MPRDPDSWPVVAGIDEAGLGPLLGPLCLGWCVIATPDPTRDLWQVLSPAVARVSADPRLFVADSKRVYDGSRNGRARLEATALAFAAAAGSPAHCLQDLWRGPAGELAPAKELWQEHPWYSHPSPWPAHQDEAVLASQIDALKACSGARVLEARVRLAPEGELNAAFARTANKARAIWRLVADLLLDLFERYGERGIHLVLDRQGGRQRYEELLATELPFQSLSVLREDREACELLLVRGRARMKLEVRPKAEDSSLPVAVASCLAKQAREGAMESFNAWFGGHQSDLTPTAGYVEDGRRWLAEAGPALSGSGVSAERLVRTR